MIALLLFALNICGVWRDLSWFCAHANMHSYVNITFLNHCWQWLLFLKMLHYLSVFYLFMPAPSGSLVCIFLSTSLFAGQKVTSWIFSCCVLAIYLGASCYWWILHGGKTTMLYLNLSGHDIFKKWFGTSPEKHCLTAMPYRLFSRKLTKVT